MIVARTSKKLQLVLKTLGAARKTVGFVPTMGYLHEGHLSLVRTARSEHPLIVASIFVNPLQFSAGEDLGRYPTDMARDKKLLKDEGCDVLFVPGRSHMYPADYQTTVSVGRLSSVLCGRHRPGHFDGVCTVVAKLLQMVRPDVLYLGQKDYQQARILRQMIADLGFEVRVRVCPTVREPDGLAMSSRNAYLSARERREAVLLYLSLTRGKELIKDGEQRPARIVRAVKQVLSQGTHIRIQYVEVVDPMTLEPVGRVTGRVLIAVAARVGAARLIDNMVVKP